MQAEQTFRSKREEIIAKFSAEAEALYFKEPIFAAVIEMLVRDIDPYAIIESLINLKFLGKDNAFNLVESRNKVADRVYEDTERRVATGLMIKGFFDKQPTAQPTCEIKFPGTDQIKKNKIHILGPYNKTICGLPFKNYHDIGTSSTTTCEICKEGVEFAKKYQK